MSANELNLHLSRVENENSNLQTMNKVRPRPVLPSDHGTWC